MSCEPSLHEIAPPTASVRAVGEALGASAQHGEIRVRHHHPCCHLCAGRSLAIRAVTISDEGRLGIEPIRHLTAGTVTGVLLAHINPPRKGPTLGASSTCGYAASVARCITLLPAT